jgi:hypothetical protein
MKKQILICPEHEKIIPLISTFAFRGAELWCPYCGYTDGMFGGKAIDNSPELEKCLKEWKDKSQSFLGAIATKTCSEMEWQGKRIKPADLPVEEKERINRIIAEYKYEGE